VDKEGCTFNNGEVIYPEGLKKNIKDIIDAQLSGITLKREYGGLFFNKTFYAAAIEIISRADASMMNFFGLQGIGETIQQFGSEELKNEYLPKLASGQWFAAMLLTEPDAGSELGAMRTTATLDKASGNWLINGTKRFITFGNGEVLVTLARSEDPNIAPGTPGISTFVVEKGKGVTLRRIEHKLGIHGSPTCELHFNNAPAKLVGERGLGITRYGSWLMKEARLAVAAQAVGISQAALVQAIKYANEREQFGQKIKEFPQVADMLADMQVFTEASRTLLYKASQLVDLEHTYKEKGLKEGKKLGRLVDIVTPLVKYYAAEMANKIATDAVQIHGGNGFTTEYPVERYLRDARITNIYEGTSQIQVIWAIVRILRGGLKEVFEEGANQPTSMAETKALLEKTKEANRMLNEAIEFVNGQEPEYWDLIARKVVDMATDVFIAYEFIKQVEKLKTKSVNKLKVARKFINDMLPRADMNRQLALSGNKLEIFF
jgi:hypothetical protein